MLVITLVQIKINILICSLLPQMEYQQIHLELEVHIMLMVLPSETNHLDPQVQHQVYLELFNLIQVLI